MRTTGAVTVLGYMPDSRGRVFMSLADGGAAIVPP